MKKIVITALLILVLSVVHSSEIDDFRFALGLYRDQNYSLAKTELIKFITSYPESSFIDNARFLLANIYLNDEEYFEALRLFEQLNASGSDPSIRPELYLGLAQCYFFTDNTDKAFNAISHFLKEFRQHRLAWKAYYLLGRLERRRGNLSASLQNLNNAEKLSPGWQILVAKVETLLALNKDIEVATIIDNYLQEQTRNEYVYQVIVLYLNHLLKNKDYQTIIDYAYDYIPSSSQFYDDYLLVLSEAKYEKGDYDKALDRIHLMSKEIERGEYLAALCYMELGDTVQAKRVFRDLSNRAVNQEIKSNSFFYLAGLLGREDLTIANNMLHQFITDNPDHPFTGAAYYQIALNHFRRNDFSDAIARFKDAIEKGIKPEFTERAHFLTAESYFQLQHNLEAMEWFNEYLQKHPDGMFVDEALFKTGLYHFEREDFPRALVQFERVINEFQESPRVSMALFYQGEIFSQSNQYDIALNKYQAAIPGFDEQGLLHLRIAQVYFLQGKYDEALTNLSSVPDTPGFLYEKNIITGNIHYAKRNYLEALRRFDTATRHSTDDKQWEDSLLRQARTLYQLKEYREAVNLYNRLYERTPNEQYLIMAATTAFTAENYSNAINFYQQYIDNYPEGRDYQQVRLHIADSYYNLKEFETAALKYQELIRPEMDRSILINSLNGLEWSALQSEDVEFVELLNRAVTSDSPPDFLALIYERKINFYYTQSQWREVINTVRLLEQVAPSEPKLFDYRRMMAIAHTRLNQIYDAERLFNRLDQEKADPQVLYAWARLELIKQDSTAALGKMKRAADLTNESRYWLDMLTLSLALRDDDFMRYYERYLRFAAEADKERAMLLNVKWNLQNKRYDNALRTIDLLLQSNFEPIKAKAQYYKGVHLYKTGNIAAAIPELLRVRYLYPRIEDVRLDAEILAIQAYLEINDRDNAHKLYDAIRNSLSPEQREKLRSLLEG